MALPRWFSVPALLLAMAGGAGGVAARAALTVPFAEDAHPLVVPAITLVVNVVGAFGLGVVVGSLGDRHPRWRVFLGTGVLGGFTTYSAFAVHVVSTSSVSPVVGLALAAVTLFGGAIAAAAGLGAGRRIVGAPGEVEPPEDAE